MISHVVLDHPNVRFKCDTCDNEFSRKIDLTMHVNKHHKHENNKNLLRKQYDELVSTIRDQKSKIFNDLYKIKLEESNKKGNCNCKGKYCLVNHARFRWTISRADEIFRKLASLSKSDVEKEDDKRRT